MAARAVLPAAIPAHRHSRRVSIHKGFTFIARRVARRLRRSLASRRGRVDDDPPPGDGSGRDRQSRGTPTHRDRPTGWRRTRDDARYRRRDREPRIGARHPPPHDACLRVSDGGEGKHDRAPAGRPRRDGRRARADAARPDGHRDAAAACARHAPCGRAARALARGRIRRPADHRYRRRHPGRRRVPAPDGSRADRRARRRRHPSCGCRALRRDAARRAVHRHQQRISRTS